MQKTTPKKIYISYRRADTAGETGRLFDTLRQHFIDEQIVMDIGVIVPGADIVEVIKNSVDSCDVFLAVIGPRWISDSAGTAARINDPKDFVRIEVSFALKQNIPVVPILMGGAALPRPDQLPPDLQPLLRRQSIEISNIRWRYDTEQLIDFLIHKVAIRPKNQKIFICYHRGNSEFVLHLAENLRKEGVGIWIDQLDISAGERWDFEIQKALDASQCVLFIASKKSVDSDHVLDEIHYALQKKKQVIPIVVDECEIPFRLRNMQYIDFKNSYNDAFNTLLKTLTLPPEILQQGKDVVESYFAQLQTLEEQYLFEAKLLILGEPGAGKTSLAWKIENVNCSLPKEEDTTKGIDVRQYCFPLRSEDFPSFSYPKKLENKQFCLNVWDFGGQEIYKATHRFFLNNRSLYALVADSRNEDTDFNYWLHMVEIFGGDSPLLIILNEKHQRKRNIDITHLRKRFTNIKEVIVIDFAEKNKEQFDELKKAIRYYVSRLSHVGNPVPLKWAEIRKALNNDANNTITRQEYLNICRSNGITGLEDAFVLSKYFHDIGVFLHFQDDVLLKNIIFLKPTWATNAVYKVLDHELLNKSNGRFTKDEARKIWNEEEFVLYQDELLKLMQKFFLIYEVDDTGEYIVPERLQSKQPDYKLDANGNLVIRYEYELFRPKGILSQFIVQMNHFIKNHNLVWRRGVVLERDGDTQAEIMEVHDNRTINIRVIGKKKPSFMTIIINELDKITSQYNKLNVEKWIPCNCITCKSDTNPHFYKLKDLERREENGVTLVQCEKSYINVSVKELIYEVIDKSILDNKKDNGRYKVFVSYSHKDRDILEKVKTHLKVLENENLSVYLWEDTQIKAGMKWKEEIENALSESKVAILLVSTAFLASDFIKKNELPPLLKAAEAEGTTIVPLILSPCRFANHKELSVYQAVNDPEKESLSGLSQYEQDKMLLKLTDRVEEIISNI